MRDTVKVLHISLSDYYNNGGTGIALYRLHRALNDGGYADSTILGREKTLRDEERSHAIPRARAVRGAERALKPVTDRLGLYEFNGLSTFSIGRLPQCQEADVIHLHCIHDYGFNYLALPTIAQGKPIVFTLHDMWGVTGRCHHPFSCDGFTKDCGHCPQLPPVHGPQLDGSRLQLRLKQWAYRNCSGGLRFVGPSRWMVDMARKSRFGDYPIDLVPHGLDTEFFRPRDKAACRERFGLPTDKNILMFGAEHINHRPKGMDLLIRALELLPDAVKRDTALLVVGDPNAGAPLFQRAAQDLGMPAYTTGYLDGEDMVLAYSAADLFLFPTRAESFGLVGLEALACGTPVVAFRVGGVPDYVRPGETGYLADPEDVEGFRRGVTHLLTNPAARACLSENGRRMVVEEFDSHQMARGYACLYARAVEEAAVLSRRGKSFADTVL
jgi:glycosyltransferase involved in cell wall biosynthesis